MSGPAARLDADPAEPAGPVDAVPDSVLGVADLTWSELADSVWLASAIDAASPSPCAGSTEPPPAGRVDEVDEPAPVEPVVRPPPAGREPSEKPVEPVESRAESRAEPSAELPAELLVEPMVDPMVGPGPAVPEPFDIEAPVREPPTGRVASAHASLPRALEALRALRPLKRYVRSARDGDVVVDEEATAERVAQDGLWLPVVRRRRERWLDLTVVVDDGPSMALWRSRVAAFVTLVEKSGVFGTVRVRRLVTDGVRGGVPLAPVLRGGTGGTLPRDPAEILDHSGRRVVLVLTDGLAPAWRADLTGPVLARWGRVMPLAVINLLPQWLWSRAGLAVRHARLTTPADLRPNRRWRVELPDAWTEPDPDAILPDDAVPIPVLELGPRWLRWWSRLISGRQHDVDATALLATDKPRPTVATYDSAAGSAAQRVAAFRSVASPQAQHLAQLLAAVPVDLQVAQLVQEAFQQGRHPEFVGELIATGLLRYAPRADAESDSDTTLFELPIPVRESLLDGARRSETARVVRTVAHHFGRSMSVLERMRDALDNPHTAADPRPTPETADEIALERVVLRALNGPYLVRANRLAQLDIETPSVDHESETMPPRPEPHDLSANDTDERTGIPSTAPEPTTARHHDPDARQPVTTLLTHPPLYSTGTSRERQPDEAPPIWGNVPQRNLSFTGRSDLLDQLDQRLTAGGTTAVLPAALHGMGGIGKTQMAMEYIYRHLQDYDVIWWIEAGRPTQIRAALTELARQLHLPGGNDASVAIPAVREALRTGRPYRRWLLVFDAAESPDQVRPFFPTNGPGEILITSRNPDWAGVARPLEVALFKREESRELMRRRSPDIADAAADEVAERLGDLPLAISQASAWLAETGMPPAEYLRLLDEKVNEMLEASAPANPDEVSVTAAWNVSFDELRNRNAAAHQILQICAFFSPEPISRDIFSGVRGVSIQPEIDVALRDPIQLARAIRDINRYSLAKIDHANNTIQLHRLVQLVLRTRLMPKQVAQQMRHGAHQLLAAVDPNDPDSGKAWRQYRELLPHIYSADVVDCHDAWVRQLVINLMGFLSQWGDNQEAAELARRALDRWTEMLGERDPQALEVAGRLGRYLWSLGRFDEAAELNQRTLRLRLEVSGENAEQTLTVQTNVVIDHRSRGEFAAGRKLSEEILQKSRKLFGDDDPVTINAAYHHALSLRLAGDYHAAAELDEDTFRRSVEVLGPDHPRAYAANVARIIDRREAGQYSWARVEQEKLTATWWERFGEDAADSWLSMFQLAVARRKDGDHAGALELSKNAFDYFRTHAGESSLDTMACLLAYSIDLRHEGDLVAARKQGELVFERYRQVLGEQHPHTIATTVDLAVTLRLLGDVAGARELNERALEQFRATVGADNPYSLVTAVNLASDHAAYDDRHAALELGTETLERSRSVLGAEHPTTLAAMLNLGYDLRADDRADEADSLCADVVDRYRRAFGEAHPATAAAAGNARANCDIDPILL
ncbi:FxSxx-COOH system tetratricopeptide repeat protein [Actinophytocola sp.]|uniref:FxSxx-COOH system tetratricopeptide repeat protein n=1 Tax=Actinophytocola sp. TaxID=1872138 RepID=UPI003D6BBA5B